MSDTDLQKLNTLEAFDYTINDYFLPVAAGDVFTNSKGEWFVLIESLGLPILLKTDQEVILKNDNAELNLELGKKVQIVKARKKVYLETY